MTSTVCTSAQTVQVKINGQKCRSGVQECAIFTGPISEAESIFRRALEAQIQMSADPEYTLPAALATSSEENIYTISLTHGDGPATLVLNLATFEGTFTPGVGSQPSAPQQFSTVGGSGTFNLNVGTNVAPDIQIVTVTQSGNIMTVTIDGINLVFTSTGQTIGPP